MRIQRLFALSMLSVTVLTVTLGTEVLIPQIHTFADRTEAIKTVEAFGAVLAVDQQVAGLRAPYVGPLIQAGAATPVQIEAIAKFGQSTDAAFASARALVGNLEDGAASLEGLDKAAAKLADVRAAA